MAVLWTWTHAEIILLTLQSLCTSYSSNMRIPLDFATFFSRPTPTLFYSYRTGQLPRVASCHVCSYYGTRVASTRKRTVTCDRTSCIFVQDSSYKENFIMKCCENQRRCRLYELQRKIYNGMLRRPKDMQPGECAAGCRGLIFRSSDDMSKTGFLYSVSRHTERQVDDFKFTTNVITTEIDNSFELAATVCYQMSTGVFLLFGMKGMSSANILHAFSSTFHMPYFTTTSTSSIGGNNTYELSVMPRTTDLLIGMVIQMNWRRFHYVYDSDEGLLNMEEIYSKMKNKNYRAQISLHRIHDVNEAHEELRRLDRTYTGRNKMIILHMAEEASYNKILREISKVGMNRQEYSYMVMTLDIMRMDLRRFLHGGANVTGFQLIDYKNNNYTLNKRIWRQLDPRIWPGGGTDYIPLDAAVAIDTFELIRRTIVRIKEDKTESFKYSFRRGVIYNFNTTKGVLCSSNPVVPWMLGETIRNKSTQIDFDGLTGKVKLDSFGRRQNYTVRIYNLVTDKGLRKIGYWNEAYGFRKNILNGSDDSNNSTPSSRRGVKIVTSIEAPPFLVVKEGKDKKGRPFKGNDRYEGYCVQLAKMVAEMSGFDYTIKLVKDKKYGHNYTNGTWDGMIGEILDGEADLAVAPLTITADRQQVVDFSERFLAVGITIMIKKPQLQKPGLFAFLKPFSLSVWLCILASLLIVIVFIFVVSRLSQFRWEGHYWNSATIFTLYDSFWFTWGAFMLQGAEPCPRSNAGRIIGGVWWFMVLILISSYTASLAAFLTIARMHTPIENADDLANQEEIVYGTMSSGSTFQFFQQSKVSTYNKMWNYMSSTHPSVFTSNVSEGVSRVRASKGKYAFLLESIYNDYHNNLDPCNTMMIGPKLNNQGLGIAVSKTNKKLGKEVTMAILKLQESGELIKMYKKWFIEKGECGAGEVQQESKRKSLPLSKLVGVFYILIIVLMIGIISVVVEHLMESKKEYKLVEKIASSATDQRTDEHVVCNGRNNIR